MLHVYDQVKLQHNQICTLHGMIDSLKPFLWRERVDTVFSLDLSCNQLACIEHEILANFTNLHFLYLHGNPIASIDGVEQIGAKLRKLKKLTLYQSPAEQSVQSYRTRVILAIPHLVSLDNVAVTAQERLDGKKWGKTLRDGVWKSVA